MTLFSFFTNVFEPTKTKERVFISSTDPYSNRTLLIEEDEYSIWAYLLRSDNEGIDFDGFLCSIKDPKTIQITPKDVIKNGVPPPIIPSFSNKFSYLKKIRKQDFKIVWKKENIIIFIKNEIYLIMDLNTRTSYSKGVSKSGPYGEPLKTP